MALGKARVGVDFTQVDTTRKFKLGTVVEGFNGEKHSVYKYVLASGALAVGKVYLLGINGIAGTAVTAANGLGKFAGIPQVAIADGKYGWVLIDGKADYINVLANCAADVALYTSATAGSLDDTATSQKLALGVVNLDSAATDAGNYPGYIAGPLTIAA